MHDHLEAIRHGIPLDQSREYGGLIRNIASKLTPQARRLGELVAPLKLDASLPISLLDLAAKKHPEISSFSDALTELQSYGVLVSNNGSVQFCHSSWQQDWNTNIAPTQLEEIRTIWYNVLQENGAYKSIGKTQLILLPFLSPTLRVNLASTELTGLAQSLMNVGAHTESLELLQDSWNITTQRQDMNVEHTLLATQIQLELGHYKKADDILRYAEKAIEHRQDLKYDALILHMKIALRRNMYPLVWRIGALLDNDNINPYEPPRKRAN